MPLWGNVDNAANSDIAALMQVSSNTSTAQRTKLYDNVTRGAFQSANVTVGQFGVDTNEMQAMQTTSHPQHAGWVLRREGTGLRAGRVWYETLVAMGSMTGDGNATEDTYIPDRRISITTQPSSNSAQTKNNVTFTVAATTVPSGGSLTYYWQRSYGSGATLSWANVANTALVFFNNTSPTLTVNSSTTTANTFRVVINVAGGNTAYTSNATFTLLP